MNVRISPSVLEGEIVCPASKSFAHRALIAAACSSSPCEIIGRLQGDDVLATASCLASLGAGIEITPGSISVTPIRKRPLNANLFVGASGSTFRFLLPLSCVLGIETSFSGTERLGNRPIGDLLRELKKHGATFSSDALPLTVSGKLTGHDFMIDGSVSSQYVTGLLLALPVLGGGTVTVQNGSVSKNYLDITMTVLRAFNVYAEEDNNVFLVRGEYDPPSGFVCESDWSSAGFFAVAGANGNVLLRNLDVRSEQGDKAVLDALRQCGATVEQTAIDSISVRKGTRRGFVFDVENCPDAAPILSVLGAMSEGKTILSGTSRLKWKESDRSAEIVRMLTAFGIRAEDQGDRLEIMGGTIRGCVLSLPDDHRIAMAASIAASAAEGETTLLHAECVNKSYPAFFDDFNKLGGKANVSL